MWELVREEVKKTFSLKVFVISFSLIIIASILHVLIIENISLEGIQTTVQSNNDEPITDYSSDIMYAKILDEKDAIDKYKSENTIQNPGQFWEFINNNILVMNIITIICIYFASIVFAKEFTKNTIKNILMAPYKRSEIYLSKIFVVFLFTIISTVITCVLSFLISLIFYSQHFNLSGVFLVFRDGAVVEYSVFGYTVMRFGLKGLEILVIALIALFISVIVRNYIISMILSFVLFFIGDSLVLLLSGKLQIMKYTLFANIDFLSYLSGSAYMNNSTLLLSLEITMIYLVVIYLISLYLFEYRDVS